MAQIFLSYRRDDTAGHAGRLYDDLESSFGAENVFFDIDQIHAGERFTDSVERVRSADVFLAVIGPQWFRPDSSGRRRIDDPNDGVRCEIEEALRQDLRVIPVLVNDGRLPSAEELPESLRQLSYRTAVQLRDEAWSTDVAKLIQALDEIAKSDLPTTGHDPAQSVPSGGIHIGSVGSSVSIGGPIVVGAERLRLMLRQAALMGVVPASVPTAPSLPESSLPGRVGTQAELLEELRRRQEELQREQEELQRQALERQHHSQTKQWETTLPASEDTGPHPEAPPARGGSRGRLRLVRFAVPLALLGAGVLVAKWLLGWFSVDIESGEQSGDTVVCTVFAPPAAAPGNTILVQAFVHVPELGDDARAVAMEHDTDAHRRTFQSLESPVRQGARIHFELRMPGLEVDDPVTSLVWQRRTEAVQFGVRVPSDFEEQAVIGTLEISVESAPVGHVKFKLAVESRRALEERQVQGARPNTAFVSRSGPSPSEPQGESARRYTAAFISYASEDRDKVLARVQMLSVAGIRYFQDLLSLEPGDRWEKKLELGIDECDLFLLFWSTESKRSEWVRREVRYALNRRGEDELSPPEIRPVLLEGPPIVEPWEELAHLHFNDRVLYFMRPLDST